ncbi:MAG: ATP-dependent DNA helicase RecG [Arenicellales bacterium]|nr:ATP-dependent DNA helicase RecG [Arenicellales bacterium]
MENTDPTDISVTAIKGVGQQLAVKLSRLGIFSVQDLLLHLPFRYEDRTQRIPLGSVQPGQRALIVGKIEQTGIAYGRRRSLVCRISDGTGWVNLRLFYFTRAQQNNLRRGQWVSCYGEIRHGRGTFEMVHPEYRVSAGEPTIDAAQTLTPVYPATEGVSQSVLRRIINNALQSHVSLLTDLIPDQLLRAKHLPTLDKAIVDLHQPSAEADLDLLAAGDTAAQRRLSLEELLAHHLSFLQLRAQRQSLRAPALKGQGSGMSRLNATLGFALTKAQQRVIAEVLDDLTRATPMLRLVQGDVGSGKTVVAAAAIMRAAENGLQSAVLAPTELLAEQHFRTFHNWFGPLNVDTVCLSSRMTVRQRRLTLSQLVAGQALVAVGTHALFQDDVEFDRLALVVVDEQHRFGVDQRLAMRDKGRTEGVIPHQLIMTATPIPRTLAMTFYTDLDVSNIDELPPGRIPVDTVVVPEERRDEVIQRIKHACGFGRQVYWVCPLIDESEALSAQDVSSTEKLLRESLPEAAIGLVHGRMKSAEKDKVMAAFRDKKLDILVATTVIEVGVDVPNASLMIIENAERLGLSQLHQLRGRVGRGHQQSACVLLYKSPLSEHARIRLAALRDTSDGFEIARQDLQLRGPGEVLGTRQTGIQRMRVSDLIRDRNLLPSVHELGKTMLQQYPQRVPALIKRWVRLGDQYGHV